MSFVVNTPNGNIGRPLVQRLLQAGKRVTIISRKPESVADLVKAGARRVEGSMEDRAVLDAAFEGATALFWLSPPPNRPDYVAWSEGVAREAARAARAHGIGRAVVLSSVGAQNGSGIGPVSSLLPVEKVFQAELPHVYALRAGVFMENLLHDVPAIARTGSLFTMMPPERKFPLVTVADIAAKAAELLQDSAWTGHRHGGAHGPEHLSYPEVADILSDALGRPVKYVRIPGDGLRQALLGVGAPAWLADAMVELYTAAGEGRLDAAEPRSKDTTTPTTLAQFARTVLLPAVEKVARAA
ncbi:NmrA family transcriptional regulator [Corallococcus sp. H22C18031201]|uniref:NmrA family NAD(P)-binding protein n=1 Tax=Citreicoccus inhibens TaxID=2849499 RepID=UPI000E75186D|nr:NAD(P)H-binding protein [Citreicoccus inhibens]MBU8896524.1 NAD(P)H-binding protein [Citreicoccus inhibens]RJS18762.1 NmrA family transcriptional regulator [Corallococcus sp. H22C18031201]